MKRVLFSIAACLVFAAPTFSQVLLQENFDTAAATGQMIDLVDNNTGQPLASPAGVQIIQPDGWTITSEVPSTETRAANAISPIRVGALCSLTAIGVIRQIIAPWKLG